MTNFSQLDLIPALQQTLSEEGYQQPTPIQARTLPPAIEGQDILGIAQTGTGKTAAFALPILNSMGKSPRKSLSTRPFALILAPTRELAIQIGESLATYGRHLHLRTCTIFGGVSYAKQVNQLKRGAHILVATPGRLLDLSRQGHLHLDKLDFFVLDEADRMLDMGFLPDLKQILRLLPDERQSLFFSATLPPSIKSLAKQLLSDPVSIRIAPQSVTIDKIDQRFFLVDKKQKPQLLRRVLMGTDVKAAIVFTKTKRGANRLSENLEKSGIQALAIHGNKSQAARQKALAAFREKRVKVLVATDVAARGIDIEGVSHVVNFDLPQEPEVYVHRIGRTGRAGADGVAISFCQPDEKKELKGIERLVGKKVHLADIGLEPDPRKRKSRISADQPSPARKRKRRFSADTDVETGSKPKGNRRRRKKTGKSNAGTEESRQTSNRKAARRRKKQPRTEDKQGEAKKAQGSGQKRTKKKRKKPGKRAVTS